MSYTGAMRRTLRRRYGHANASSTQLSKLDRDLESLADRYVWGRLHKAAARLRVMDLRGADDYLDEAEEEARTVLAARWSKRDTSRAVNAVVRIRERLARIRVKVQP